jgi:hypothetical protein
MGIAFSFAIMHPPSAHTAYRPGQFFAEAIYPYAGNI